LFLNADPMNTGMNSRATVCRRIAALSSSTGGDSSARKYSAMAANQMAIESACEHMRWGVTLTGWRTCCRLTVVDVG